MIEFGRKTFLISSSDKRTESSSAKNPDEYYSVQEESGQKQLNGVGGEMRSFIF